MQSNADVWQSPGNPELTRQVERYLQSNLVRFGPALDEKSALQTPCRVPVFERAAPLAELSHSEQVVEGKGFRFEIGALGLPRQLQIGQEEVLRELSLFSDSSLTDGSPVVVWEEVGSDRGILRWQVKTRLEKSELTVDGSVESDGFVKIRIDVELQQSEVDRNWGLFFRGKEAKEYWYSAYSRNTQVDLKKKKKSWHDIEHKYGRLSQLPALPFSNTLLLSRDNAALNISFESDRWWLDPDKAGYVLSEDRSGDWTLSTVFARAGSSLQKKRLQVEFALNLLPNRLVSGELPLDFERFNPGQIKDLESLFKKDALVKVAKKQISLGDALKKNASEALDGAMPVLVIHQDWTPWQGSPELPDRQTESVLRQLVDYAHSKGKKVLVYLGLEISSASPAWARYAMASSNVPVIAGRERDGARSIRPNSASSCYHQFLIEGLLTLKQGTGIDGVFLDLIPQTRLDANILDNRGYLDNQGTLRGEVGLFSTRELIRNIYRVFHSSHAAPGIVIGHVVGPYEPSHSYLDYALVGEGHIKKARLEGTKKVEDILPLEMLRSGFNWRVTGVPYVWLIKEERGGPGVSEARSALLPAGVFQRTQWPYFVDESSPRAMFNDTQEVLLEWRIWRFFSKVLGNNYEFLPGWDRASGLTWKEGSKAVHFARWSGKEDQQIIVVGNPSSHATTGRLCIESEEVLSAARKYDSLALMKSRYLGLQQSCVQIKMNAYETEIIYMGAKAEDYKNAW